jgi:FAD/FMN-containing dehydrogenase
MTKELETLRRDFDGDIVEPDAENYEAARATAMVSGSPALVLRPNNAADVQAAVRFAAHTGLALSVRGGGHSYAGFGTNDGGVVIDLAMLAGVDVVDDDSHLVRIGGGATWGGVADALAPRGLAISSGDARNVGVGGLTLSGGIGWKVRKYGLTLDALVAADVVIADGTLVRASTSENPDLFWALRGGGGNFGIVTAFELTAHPTTDIFFGTITFAASEVPSVLSGWADYARLSPEELTTSASFAHPYAGGPEAPIEIRVAFDSDDRALADAAIDPIRRLGTVVGDTVALMPYAQTLEDAVAPPGIEFLARSALVDAPSVPEVLRILADIGTSGQPPYISVRSLGGAVARVPDNATAYAHRQAELMVITNTVGPKMVVESARPSLEKAWDRLEPHVRGSYGSFLTSATERDVAAIYPSETYGRLTEVKRGIDPGNLFAHNHNIPPQ